VRELLGSTWKSRDLVSILARKDFFVRYRRATFGLVWAAALPLLQAVVVAFVVSKFAAFHTGTDYVAFVLAGTVPWAAFSATLAAGSTSIVDGAQLSAKIYFPRIVLPVASALAAAYGLTLSVAAVLIVSLATGVSLGPEVLWLVPGIVLGTALATAFSVVLSALHVYFRDVRYLVQAALLVWVYLTPVFYPLSAIGGAQRFLLVNPMTGVIELYRAATVGAEAGWIAAVLWSIAWCIGLMLVGIGLHRRYDRVFVDLL
jgi:lipopolysaccharide transport system permease protein